MGSGGALAHDLLRLMALNGRRSRRKRRRRRRRIRGRREKAREGRESEKKVDHFNRTGPQIDDGEMSRNGGTGEEMRSGVARELALWT